LRRSLKSLDRQSDSDFDAVLVLDGLNAENLPPDITEGRPWLCIEEAGETVNLEHRAGDMRNMGISRATGLFVGFLDDDDTLSPNYVSALKEEIALHSDFHHSPDVVLSACIEAECSPKIMRLSLHIFMRYFIMVGWA
jgi:hypothetical protein